MSKRFSITILIIIFGVFIIPQITSAAILPFDFGNDSIVPCGRTSGPAEVTQPCNLCHLFKGIKNIINLVLSLVILIAPLIIIYGGFVILSSGGKPERVTLGKSIITYVVIGLVIVFGAWLIINTVMNGLVGSNKSPLPWNKIECAVTSGTIPGDDDEEKRTDGLNENVCDKLDPPLLENKKMKVGECQIGSTQFFCNSGVNSQIKGGFVSSDIQSLIIAMYFSLTSEKSALYPFGLGETEGKKATRVSSLSDNSLGQCNDNYLSLCPDGKDSCEGTCCGHRQNSDHYCNGKSYAVDFGEEQYAYEICHAILLVVGEKKAFILKEDRHVHVSLGEGANCPVTDPYNITQAVCDGMK